MNYYGAIIGAAAFVIIGVLHPVVIKAEYYLGKRCWPLFAATGILAMILSFVAKNIVLSAILAVLGFSLFWSIKELFEQEERVRKGWHPANPRKNKPQ